MLASLVFPLRCLDSELSWKHFTAGFVFCDKNRLRGHSQAKAVGYEPAFLRMLELRCLGSSLEEGVWSSVCLCIPQLFDTVLLVGLCFTCRTKTRAGGGGNVFVWVVLMVPALGRAFRTQSRCHG